jgi:hypothetical protein
MSVCCERTIIVNLGGTAEVVYSDFCPFWGRSLLFYNIILLKGWCEDD